MYFGFIFLVEKITFQSAVFLQHDKTVIPRELKGKVLFGLSISFTVDVKYEVSKFSDDTNDVRSLNTVI